MLKGDAQVAYFSPFAVVLFEGSVLLPALQFKVPQQAEFTPGKSNPCNPLYRGYRG